MINLTTKDLARVTDIQELGSSHMFIAEVLGVYVDEKYMDEKGKFTLADSKPIAYKERSSYNHFLNGGNYEKTNNVEYGHN